MIEKCEVFLLKKPRDGSPLDTVVSEYNAFYTSRNRHAGTQTKPEGKRLHPLLIVEIVVFNYVS
jgi:hypothetical protein